MTYEICVSRDGKHFFTTTATYIGNASDLFETFLKKFTAKEGFHIEVYAVEVTKFDAVDVKKFAVERSRLYPARVKTGKKAKSRA